MGNNGARETKFDLLDDGGDGEHNDFVYVEMYKIFVIQEAVFVGMNSFDRIYCVRHLGVIPMGFPFVYVLRVVHCVLLAYRRRPVFLGLCFRDVIKELENDCRREQLLRVS